jgi:hypothetical protein
MMDFLDRYRKVDYVNYNNREYPILGNFRAHRVMIKEYANNQGPQLTNLLLKP